MPKKLKQKEAQVNKPEFIYQVDKVFDSGTTANFTNTSYTSCDTNWTVKVDKAGKKFVTNGLPKFDGKYKKYFDATIPPEDSYNPDALLCHNCGNICDRKKALDGKFCGAECKYKYCEIEDEADKHSE
jgi:hypothetical protein